MALINLFSSLYIDFNLKILCSPMLLKGTSRPAVKHRIVGEALIMLIHTRLSALGTQFSPRGSCSDREGKHLIQSIEENFCLYGHILYLKN
jgi:hypothetical protein